MEHTTARRACLVCLALLAGVASAQVATAPKGSVYVVVTCLKVDESGEVPLVDPSAGLGATVRLTPRDGQPVVKTAAPLQLRGQTYHTADFEVAFDTTYDLTMVLPGGTTFTMKDYRLDSEWTKVPIFTFNNTTGTRSPASVLRVERDAASKLGCYAYALWPLEGYRQVGGKQF